MGMAVVTLKKGEGRLLKSGGMWIFDNEIDTVMGNFENGDIVLVHDFDGYPMGRGFINTNSKITVRLMTRDENVDIKQLGLVGRTKEQVLQAMAEKYEVDESVAPDDLDRFLQQLRNAEILEETNE